MIDALSPLSRKVIAVALLLLCLVTLLNMIIVPLWQSCSDNLDDLATARWRLAQMRGIASEQMPEQGDAVPATAMIISPNRDGAMATLIGAVGASAAKTKIVSPSITPVAQAIGPATKLAVDVVASGSEVDLVAFLADIEGSSPAIRLQRWSVIAPDVPGAPAHIEARAVAIWAARP
jgi:hypothetical protein